MIIHTSHCSLCPSVFLTIVLCDSVGLAAQRGSLHHLLDWVDMALCASAASSDDSSEASCVTYQYFVDMLLQMKRSAVSSICEKHSQSKLISGLKMYIHLL